MKQSTIFLMILIIFSLAGCRNKHGQLDISSDIQDSTNEKENETVKNEKT